MNPMYANKYKRSLLSYKCMAIRVPRNYWQKLGKKTAMNINEIENLLDDAILEFYWGKDDDTQKDEQNT